MTPNTPSADPFQILASDCQEVVLRLGPEGVTFANPATQKLTGQPLESLVGLMPGELLDPPPPPCPAGAGREVHTELLGLKGRRHSLEGHAYGLDTGETLVVLSGQASMIEVGFLAAGLVHNLSGPLSVIRSTAELAHQFLGLAIADNQALREAYDQWPKSVQNGSATIIEQVDQVSNAIRDLLAKLKGEAARTEAPQDINAILRREVNFLDNDLAIKNKVIKQLKLDPDLPEVYGLYSDFSHSFRNILRNAMQAMQGQKVRILRVSTHYEGGSVVAAISDTGRGVPQEALDKIFEPFYSGAPPGGGAGLGLHSVRQLLEPYGAAFEVASKPGSTTFTVRLPLRREPSHG